MLETFWMLISSPQGCWTPLWYAYYSTGRMLITSLEGCWKPLCMIITPLEGGWKDANYFTVEMLETNMDAKYSSKECWKPLRNLK